MAASIAPFGGQHSASEPPLNQPQQTPAPATHKIKIWTNEDLIATRTPADIYIFEKEAQAAADEAAAFNLIVSCFAPEEPVPNLQETRKEMEETTLSIREAEDALAQAKRQVAEDPENLRTRDQAEVNRHADELNKQLERLHMLQERLRDLTNQPATPPASAEPPERP